MNKILEAKLKDLPRSPGVYFHKSKSGEIIYVGKAAVLKNRVRQYFQSSRNFDVKTLALVNEIHDTDWVETESEIDALFLESEMVKRYMPRYNILLRDDKSQLFIRIDMKNEWPYVCFTRNPSDDGADYYGPFYNGLPVKTALRHLRRVYPYLTKPPEKRMSKLEQDLGLSPKFEEGPETYKQNLRKLVSYIKGNRVALMKELETTMKQAAKEQDFEKAVTYRNKLNAMRELQRRVMFGDSEFLDISKDKALNDLVELLGLKVIPKRIEGYDISHMGGTNVVASMVVFTNGASDRAQYRKFKTKIEHNNDFYNMNETITRRFSPKNLSAWGTPNLVVIDGGKGQLEAAIKARDGREQAMPFIGLAKREEQIVIHHSKSNVILNKSKLEALDGYTTVTEDFTLINLPHSSHVVKLLQRIRDESHRFAVSYHTVLKRKKQTANTLEEIPGVGPATRKKLIKVFGSMRTLQSANAADIAKVVGTQKAQTIIRYLERP
ncbi:MAG TPA: excinuclease ABC subunit UvrC [Candidatus Saccharibacteria bacterium]|nr:excinuclease ABC subunit UvrC [Candidatus Saccharibacteria bacterium]HRK94550.1 excinuclease ABC subunit UvrC [Candidatus Saccharibacteria bacterium]